MDNNKARKLLEKYQLDLCNEEEVRLVEKWFAELNNSTYSDMPESELDENLNVIKGKIYEQIGKNSRPRIRIISWISVAASLIILLSISLSFFRWKTKEQNNKISLVTKDKVLEKNAGGWVIITTGRGVTKKITLSDGSNVVLNASSKIRYPLKFSGSKRPVYLEEGEAFFSVAKDKTKPFTVYTSKFATTALGTAFNIRAYQEENNVSISLLHGKVKIDDLAKKGKENTSKILMPHQQLVLNKQSKVVIKQNFSEESNIVGWKDGVLAFNNSSATEVINNIENHYDVVIDNQSSHTNWNYTGAFKNESLKEVLETTWLSILEFSVKTTLTVV